MTTTDEQGEFSLHISCKNGYALEVIQGLMEEHETAVKTPDQDGCLPLHHACMNEQSSFEVIEALIDAYPKGLSVRNNEGKSPFDWDYDKTPGEHFSKFIAFVVKPLWRAQDSSSQSQSKDEIRQSTIAKKGERFRLLGHCKNYVPLDILKLGYLDKKNLQSKELIRWLNEVPCRRRIVFFVVIEFYLHMAWIYTFVFTSYTFFETPDQSLGGRPIALLVLAAMFLGQEIVQLFRFYITNSMSSYWLDVWNWMDITTVLLVISSAIKFLQDDYSLTSQRLVMATGCFQSLLFLSYLKKTFFPFSKFVSGIIKIVWAVMPFLVVSFTTLFTFSFMYFIEDFEYQTEPNIRLLDEDSSHSTLVSSFRTVLQGFTGETTSNHSILDLFYGIVVVIILLNVIIAVVSEEWEDAVAEADAAFWNYRLDLIVEKTRGIDYNYISKSYKALAKYRDYLGEDLDEYFINSETAGTTMEEMNMKLSLAFKENNLLGCTKLVLKSLVFILLGFPTCGILWPKFFRQMLFTPPNPKEQTTKDDSALSSMGSVIKTEPVTQYSSLSVADSERDRLEREITEYKREVSQEIAEYRREVSELSQKVSDQNVLLEQLLKKLSLKED